MSNLNNIFHNRSIVIATMHQKEKVIAPILSQELGLQVIVPQNFNTDQFGTFTREIKRAGDQLQAARKKAEAAMEITGADIAISSEGIFGAHPQVPLMQSNLELVLLIDKKNNLEIKGHHRTSETNLNSTLVLSVPEALKIAEEWGFPENGIIVRKSEKGKLWIYKDIDSFEKLERQVSQMLKWPFTNQVFIETDMRAHKNPLRMESIKKATEDLVKNLKSICPQCNFPGFVVTNIEKGLICKACRRATDLPAFEIYSCLKCKHEMKVKITKYGEFASAEYCEFCNP